MTAEEAARLRTIAQIDADTNWKTAMDMLENIENISADNEGLKSLDTIPSSENWKAYIGYGLESAKNSLESTRRGLKKAYSECSICSIKVATIAFIPCGHLCACNTCTEDIFKKSNPKCPICKIVPTDNLLIYGKNCIDND